MEKIGVEAVIKGLTKFMDGAKQIDQGLEGIRNQGTLLQRAFGAVGDTFSGFGGKAIDAMRGVANFIANTLAHAFGELLADAVQWAARQIKEVVENTIDAGKEFQTLELRLERLNFNDLVESGDEYADVSKEAIRLTKEQLKWIQKLAVQTPYDNTDIANVYTLARSYGYADKKARSLTESVTDFAAGMGLSGEHIERIIINLGQMEQQGKITGTELRDLARGSFVPVNDILQRVAENMGITTEELNKLRSEGLVPASEFITAFQQVVEERFVGAAEKMAETIQGATDNMKDFVKSIVGFNIIKPILDTVGKKIAKFMDKLTEEKRWDAIVEAADRIAAALVSITEGLMGMLPSATSMADGVVVFFQKIADWLEENKDDIIQFFKDMGDRISNDVIPFVKEMWERFVDFVNDPAWTRVKQSVRWLVNNIGDIVLGILGMKDGLGDDDEKTFVDRIADVVSSIAQWVSEHKDEIIDFFRTAGEKIGELVGALVDNKDTIIGVFEGMGDAIAFIAPILIEDVLPAITSILTFLSKNKEGVLKFLKAVAIAFIAWQIIATIAGMVIGLIAGVVAFMVTLAGAVGFIIAFPEIAIAALAMFLGFFIGIFAAIVGYLTVKFWPQIKEIMSKVLNDISNPFKKMWDKVEPFFTNLGKKVHDFFYGIGETADNALGLVDWLNKGLKIMEGIGAGIMSGVGWVIDIMIQAASDIWNAFLDALDAHSPSKLFEKAGKWSLQGYGEGILDQVRKTTQLMQGAMAQVAMPALAMPSILQTVTAQSPAMASNVTNTQNYTLNLNSSARTEPIIQDFNMMASLAG